MIIKKNNNNSSLVILFNVILYKLVNKRLL